MITEDYVSFETAKLLKEKGFDDEYTNAFYDKNGNLYFIDILSDFSEHPDNDTDITASTLYVAMKWLREVHGLFIEVHIVGHSTAYMDNKYYFYKLYKNRRPLRFVENTFLTYEEACEAAIKYCLENLI